MLGRTEHVLVVDLGTSSVKAGVWLVRRGDGHARCAGEVAKVDIRGWDEDAKDGELVVQRVEQAAKRAAAFALKQFEGHAVHTVACESPI